MAPNTDQNEDTHNEQPASEPPKEDTKGPNRKSNFPEDFPVSLNSIKEYIPENDGDTYIPLHSTIPLKNDEECYIYHVNLAK